MYLLGGTKCFLSASEFFTNKMSQSLIWQSNSGAFQVIMAIFLVAYSQYPSSAFNSNNFLLSERLGPADWHTANKTCEEKGMQLLKITSQEMDDYLNPIIGGDKAVLVTCHAKETTFLVRIFNVFQWTCSKLEHGITRKAG